MDIQVRHMNTVKLFVKRNQIRELQSDLRKWQIKHLPFSRQDGGVDVILLDCPKANWIVLKYG